jgi:hypothetical protein
MMTTRPTGRAIGSLLLAACLFLLPSRGSATPAPYVPSPLPANVAVVPIAESVSWHGFAKYWQGFVNNTDRVILVVGIVAASALFIITRGKWLK